MWDGFNQRKFPRIHLNCNIGIVPADGARTITAKTENVGIGGVCVVLDEALERFQSCKLKLNLDGKQKKIECAAQVAWVVPTKKAKARKTHYDTGLEFVDIDDNTKKMIETFLAAHTKG